MENAFSASLILLNSWGTEVVYRAKTQFCFATERYNLQKLRMHHLNQLAF